MLLWAWGHALVETQRFAAALDFTFEMRESYLRVSVCNGTYGAARLNENNTGCRCVLCVKREYACV